MIKRKKGAVILLELLGAIFLFFMLGWCIMQILFYTMASSITQQAAQEGARIVASEFRGLKGDVLPNRQVVKDKFETKIKNVTQFNTLILLYKNYDGSDASVTPIWSDKASCDSALNSAPRVICAYIERIPSSADVIDQEQVVVIVKAPFKVVGSFIPGLNEKFHARGKGVSQIEQADRFQYYKDGEVIQ